jgi:hypothetical protein
MWLKVKVNVNITGLERHLGLQKVEASTISIDNRHMKVTRFSAISTGRLYPPGVTPATHFC